MLVTPGTKAQSRSIARIYQEAFPASIRHFFGPRGDKDLLDFLELSFSLVFFWGGKVLLAHTEEGEISGYCLYNPARGGRKDFKNLGRAGFLLLSKVRLREIALLTRNQILKLLKTKKSRPAPKKTASIISIAVAPQFQGRGIGTLLLGRALQELSSQWVLLNVRSENSPARRLYRQAGFTPYGSTEDLLGSWVMLKKPPR
ncbi:MAG: GNAT family N-acetyltransferase [Firmicutes bacterium]|nr:GNAT family N-acetyltransferase [Bacillota bacterium]